jgi:hypothetical protein
MKALLVLAILASTAHADDVTDLANAKQATRDTAANHLRERNAAAAHDVAYWTKRLAEIKIGSPVTDLETKLSAKSEAGGSSGQSTSTSYRLDDYNITEITFDIQTQKILFIGKVENRPRSVWVDPPKDFSGHWKTFFVDGKLERDYEYAHGVYVTTSDYYDNGQLAMTRHYVAGKLEGPEVAFHPNGKKAYEGAYKHDKSEGHWLYWFPSGKVETDQTYVDGALHGTSTTNRETGEKSVFEYDHGKETGQASWDAHGKLEYAHGTAEAHYKRP